MKNLFSTSNRTIGVAIPIFWSGQFYSSLRGILDACKHLDINLICFQGTYFGSFYDSQGHINVENAGNIIFDLLKKVKIDGLIIHTGSLRSHEHKINLLKLCKETFSIPMVNVGSTLEGITNIKVNNEHGMRELLNHLIHNHGYKKFGFIKGPVENNDAQIRFNTFKKVLNENDIPINDDLVIPSKMWSFDEGKNGVLKILKKSKDDVEIIVCASDLLASGALYELTKQCIKVPEQVGVVGFNDNNYAETCFPPLTTVTLKMYERSWKAVEILNECFSGIVLPENASISSTMILRESCGCSSIGVQSIVKKLSHIDSSTSKFREKSNNYVNKIKEKLLLQIKHEKISLPVEIINRFAELYISQLLEVDNNEFICQFSELLIETAKSDGFSQTWHQILNIVEQYRNITVISSDSSAIECILMQARVLIGEIVEQQYKITILQNEGYKSIINSVNYGFNKVSKIKDIIDLIWDKMPGIGIASCYLSLYENMNKPLDKSKCVLAYHKGKREKLPLSGISFNTEELIPENIQLHKDSKMMIIEPLYYSDEQIGFTLFEVGSLDKSFYSLFPSQLSAALQAALMLTKEQKTERKLIQQANKLKKKNNELKKWTLQLEDALQKLQENHDRLFSFDKMASIGRLTAGIAHEMTTPLATLRSSLDEMERLTNEYKLSIPELSVTGDDHREIVREFKCASDLARKAIEKSTDFISSIKAQARDVKGSEKQKFDVVSIVNGVILFLGYSLKRKNCTVDVSFTKKKIELYGSPTKFTQVLTNLVSNAIDSMDSGGIIDIHLNKNQNKEINISIQDSGCGIEEKNLKKIFKPMFTTKPFGKGTGLGLSIVQDILTTEFNGSIHVKSKKGIGTTFFITVRNYTEGVYKDG